MQGLEHRIGSALARVADAGRWRERSVLEMRSRGTTRVVVHGTELLAFCSNDYLGLVDHPEVVGAFVAADEHHALEDELAEFTGRERALLFSTGYMANLAVVTTLVGRGDRVLEDRSNHASLLDAGLASGARFRRYPHADVGALSRHLAQSDAGRTLVVTDGVFSMDGDAAPLPAMAAACREAGATLFVDDAHGFGVLGPGGRGSLEAAGLGQPDVPILMATLGKALGTSGAFVAGASRLVELLLQRARSYIYTTAPPPAVAGATRAALRIVQREPWRRTRALQHAARFCREAAGMGLRVLHSTTPIQPVILGPEPCRRSVW